MFKAEKICNKQIIFYLAGDPFSIKDIEDIDEPSRAGTAEFDDKMPAIADFRNVDLTSVPSIDLKSFLFKRGQTNAGSIAGPLACLCGNAGTFGMARMYGTLGDIWSVRDEDYFYPCYDVEQGVDWLLRKTNLVDVTRESVLKEVAAARLKIGGLRV